MKNRTFLEYVAEDLIKKYGHDLSRTAVVFPNKRAALFMNEHLARIARQPIWSPAYITISDLFRRHSQYAVADQIKLICDLHKVFTKCAGLDETIDHFYGWGQLLLADFDDLDKNMGDADRIFCNLYELHEYDDTSYITEEQKELLKRFFANFESGDDTELKRRFSKIWLHLKDIYHSFNDCLRAQKLGYEGAVYREVATRGDIDFEYDNYVFVGFNMLQEVEKTLFKKLQEAGKAHFYWDFDKAYMPHAGSNAHNNEAGHFISQYLADFPNELDNASAEIYDNLANEKKITYISASTENAQAKYASAWLRENNRYADGRDTAVIMCDENILLPVVHSLPPEADKVNITSGYPLGLTPVSSLTNMLIDLYTVGSTAKGDCYRLHYVNRILKHPYARHISPAVKDVMKELQEHKQYYPSCQTLTIGGEDKNLCLLFPPYCSLHPDSTASASGNAPTFNERMLNTIAETIKVIGTNAKDESDAFFQESIFRMYTILNRLISLTKTGDLTVDTTTLRRLIKQLVDSTTIPFHGEPVVGIQIMGVLETRNLDFKHVLLLSCNEGNMPKGVNDSSFIPYTLRKAHGLTTIDNKVAIYSYYFHSILQRAEDITILYNDTTDNGHTGEMSRFMLQLMVDGNHRVTHRNILAPNAAMPLTPKPIDKNGSIAEVLDKMDYISPSAINNYIRCQLLFFYKYIAGITEPDNNDDDEVDNRIFGNIFHKAAYLIYEEICRHKKTVDKADIQKYADSRQIITSLVNRAFDEELFKTGNMSARYNGMQIINREVIVKYLTQLLQIDSTMAPFTILGLEQPVYKSFTVDVDGTQKNVRIGGIIDRLDKVVDPETGRDSIRVVDYKTGNKPSKKITCMEDVFSDADISKQHSDYFLQTMLYSQIVRDSVEWNAGDLPVSPALLFIKQAAKEGYDPVLAIDDERIADIRKYDGDFTRMLTETLAGLFSKTTPFEPTDDEQRCEYCPYRRICGL